MKFNLDYKIDKYRLALTSNSVANILTEWCVNRFFLKTKYVPNMKIKITQIQDIVIGMI
jgi:hypothetical protein